MRIVEEGTPPAAEIKPPCVPGASPRTEARGRTGWLGCRVGRGLRALHFFAPRFAARNYSQQAR